MITRTRSRGHLGFSDEGGSLRAGGQGQLSGPLRAAFAEGVGEFLDALPESGRQAMLRSQLLSQANGGMEITGARPATGGTEKMHPAFFAHAVVRTARAETLFNLRGLCETVSGGV